MKKREKTAAVPPAEQGVTAPPLRFVTHAAPFEREHPVASVAFLPEEEKASRDRADREDLFGGMI